MSQLSSSKCCFNFRNSILEYCKQEKLLLWSIWKTCEAVARILSIKPRKQIYSFRHFKIILTTAKKNSNVAQISLMKVAHWKDEVRKLGREKVRHSERVVPPTLAKSEGDHERFSTFRCSKSISGLSVAELTFIRRIEDDRRIWHLLCAHCL